MRASYFALLLMDLKVREVAYLNCSSPFGGVNINPALESFKDEDPFV